MLVIELPIRTNMLCYVMIFFIFLCNTADIRELALDPSDQYCAAPLEHDMFEWHFTIRGAVGTDFEGGVYHGRILVRLSIALLSDVCFLFLSSSWSCFAMLHIYIYIYVVVVVVVQCVASLYPFAPSLRNNDLHNHNS